MNKKLINKLNELITYLEDVVQVLKEIVAEEKVPSLDKAPQPTAIEEIDTLHRLKQFSRDQAKNRLELMNKKQQIEPLLRQLGGSHSEAKRPKAYVIDRILWHLFDFSRESDLLPEVSPLDKMQQLTATEEINALAHELKQLTRDQAKNRLELMNKKQQVEPLFRQLGNSSSEAKRPKAYVIDRILWHLFDVSK